MNANLEWTANSSFAGDPDVVAGNPCCYDVESIAIHEFGHFHAALADLYDADESELTMYGYGAPGELKKRTRRSEHFAIIGLQTGRVR